MRTSAAAAPAGGTDLSLLRTRIGAAAVLSGRTARSISGPMVDQDREPWEVVQVVDTITPGNPHYSEASRLAKTLLKDGQTWGCGSGRRIQAGARQQHA